MGAVVQDVSNSTAGNEVVTLGALAEMTGFPVEYIKRELLLGEENIDGMTMDDLRQKVLAYLDSNF
jgi:hypothetical protein